MEIIRFKDAKVTEWSGGKTHELLIHPHGSDFKSGNYDLRISVATVNLETTVFTPLPGVNRTLTVLEGNLTLIHEAEAGNFQEVYLKPYQQDSFQGDWKTRSRGKVKDFNLMWKSGDATVRHSSYSPNASYSIEGKDDVSLVFLAKGSFTFDGKTVQANDAVVIHGTLELRTSESCEIIKVEFNY